MAEYLLCDCVELPPWPVTVQMVTFADGKLFVHTKSPGCAPGPGGRGATTLADDPLEFEATGVPVAAKADHAVHADAHGHIGVDTVVAIASV